VHELTYQAAAYDLLTIPNDVYTYVTVDGMLLRTAVFSRGLAQFPRSSLSTCGCTVLALLGFDSSLLAGNDREQQKQVFLGEHDDVWVDLRHHHISTVFREVKQNFDDFCLKAKELQEGKSKKVGRSTCCHQLSAVVRSDRRALALSF